MRQLHSTGQKNTLSLAVAALGIVYGDIGTSPLYALKEVFGSTNHPVPITPDNVLGILSLVFWALLIVITGKYVSFVMRADNRGEGGVMALMALSLRDQPPGVRRQAYVMIGLFGAALFYGDGAITPAMSVLSAVEGLEVIAPSFGPFIVPISLVVVVALFVIQRHGTAGIGRLFSPVMLLWFAAITILGLVGILRNPSVLRALNPEWAIGFIFNQPTLAFFSLGGVVLALTGGEALYADMGHFGRVPIQFAWCSVVMPALLVNYFGQGALLLANAHAVANPFFLLAPEWALVPVVAVSTVAAVIASQAVISGAYSMTQQAMKLGYLPRLEVSHTSEQEMGQVYLPAVNWLLFVAVVLLIIGFESSINLGAAYGVAVTGTMLITNVLAFAVVRDQWKWSRWRALLCTVPFCVIDVLFFAANAAKILDGGWFPLALGGIIFTLLATWKRGRELLNEKLGQDSIALAPFIKSLSIGESPRVPGTAIFLTGRPEGVPRALLHCLKHYKVLHERVAIVTIRFFDVPYVPEIDRVEIAKIGDGFWQITVQYGFMDEPDLPGALGQCAEYGLEFDMMDTSFILGRETLIPSHGKEIALWRANLFSTMYRNANSIDAFLKIPSNRVVVLGAQVVI